MNLVFHSTTWSFFQAKACFIFIFYFYFLLLTAPPQEIVYCHLTFSLASSSATSTLSMSSLTTYMNLLCNLPLFLQHGNSIFSILGPIYPLSLHCTCQNQPWVSNSISILLSLILSILLMLNENLTIFGSACCHQRKSQVEQLYHFPCSLLPLYECTHSCSLYLNK